MLYHFIHLSFLVLPTRHWLFQSDSKLAPKSEYPRLGLMWFCAFSQTFILIIARCFSSGRISYSNYDGMAYTYAIFQWVHVIAIWSITILCTVMAWQLTKFYSFFEQQLFTFLTFTRKLPSHEVFSFLAAIGKDGMAYLIRMGDITDNSKMQ